MNFNKDIVNINELSDYLKCSISMIRKLIYNDEIPFFKIGNRYMFDLYQISEWIYKKTKNLEEGDNYETRRYCK